MVSTNLIHISKRLGKLDCRVARPQVSVKIEAPPQCRADVTSRHTGDRPAARPASRFSRNPFLPPFETESHAVMPVVLFLTQPKTNGIWFINAQWCTSHSGSGWLKKKQLVVWNAEMQGDFGRSYSWNPLECHYHMILIYEKKRHPAVLLKETLSSEPARGVNYRCYPLFVHLGGSPFNYNPPTNVGTLPKKLTAKAKSP